MMKLAALVAAAMTLVVSSSSVEARRNIDPQPQTGFTFQQEANQRKAKTFRPRATQVRSTRRYADRRRHARAAAIAKAKVAAAAKKARAVAVLPKPRPVAQPAPAPVQTAVLPEVPLAALVKLALETLRPIDEAMEREVSRAILEATKAKELAEARAYLVKTATPGATMTRDGPANNIAKLHPVFVLNLAAAIREARASGLTRAGIYSAYRAPGWGVGGFGDKFNSTHAYGTAVDMAGVGRAGSDDSKKWFIIAWKHKIVNPYGWRHRKEWNHYQAFSMKAVRRGTPLRATITRAGPIELPRMWQVAEALISATRFDGPAPVAQRINVRRPHSRRPRSQYATRTHRRAT